MKKSHLSLRDVSDKSELPLNFSQARARRRRVLPLATAAAAMGLAGCGSMSWPGASQDNTPITQPSQQEMAAERVKQFTSNIDIALDQVDRDRLRAAAEKKNQAAVAAVAAAPAGQSPVILASSNNANSPEPTPQTASTAGPALAPISAGPQIFAEQPSPAKASAPTPIAAPPAAPANAIAVKNTPSTNEPQAALAVANINIPAAASAEKPALAVKPAAADNTAVAGPIAMPSASSPSAMGAMTATATPAPEKVQTPMTPVIASAPAAEPTMEDALEVMRKRVAAHPTLNSALALALLDTGDDKAGEVAKSLSPADQKVFTDLLAALQGMNDTANSATTGNAPATVADRAAPLVNAAKKWQADADLSLPRLALASRVDSFGVYTAVQPTFEQGKRHTVIIYCEVANFTSKKSDDGWYQTSLSQQETLLTDDGLLVWRPNAEEVEDRSLNQRRDFYLVKKLTIPDNLAAGKYTLRMSVTDRNTSPNKISMVSLPVEIK